MGEMVQGPAVVSEAGSVGTNCNDLGNGVIARSASPSESTTMPLSKEPIRIISQRLLRDTISVIEDLLESSMMDVLIENDGRKPKEVYGGELAILAELKSLLGPSEDKSVP
jgi:hypothetical protein